ncbi:type II CAAX endopeptidase family protein [Halanaerocella petrolearia]
MKQKISCFELCSILIVVNILWWLVFRSSLLNFWFRLSLVAIIQVLIAMQYTKFDLSYQFSDLFRGLLTACLLYFIFWLSKKLSLIILPYAETSISAVYRHRQELSLPLISFLLLLVVGPAEEIFWRGFIQEELMQRIGLQKGYWVTTILYTLLHIGTGNLLLILAALVAGLFWGYIIMVTDNLMLVIISHALWDILVFILFPF